MSSVEPEPIFFVGAPRSGTTVTFEQFAAHEDLAWVLNYARVLPRLQAINLLRRVLDNDVVRLRGAKNQFNDRPVLNKLLPRPDESYQFWNAYADPQFDKRFLLGQQATSAQSAGLRTALEKVRRYQNRARVTAKMTGPGRLAYLHSVWPDMWVVHVIRDGLKVVRSLLNESFWQDNDGYTTPWWQGGLEAEELSAWEAAGSEPGALAAMQWRRIVETTRQEGAALGDRYMELRYEDYLQDPAEHIARVQRWCGLTVQGDNSANAPVMRNQTYREEWDDSYRNSLIGWMAPLYHELGYGR